MILVVAVFNLIERALHLSGAYSLLRWEEGHNRVQVEGGVLDVLDVNLFLPPFLQMELG